jgi:hypothetical protein
VAGCVEVGAVESVFVFVVGMMGDGMGESVCALWTSTGSHPPGACLTFDASIPRSRGIEGPVRSMSRMPTE